MKRNRKGQYYIIKPIALIMVILVIFIFFYSLQTHKINTTKDAKALDMIVGTSSTIAILTNSEDCIAYNPLELGVYGSIVSKDKLDDFKKKYSSVEPECSRNYLSGWHAEVEDLMTEKVWTFGAPDYSDDMADKVLDNRMYSSMPIAIRYSSSEVNPGRLKITTFEGDLERVSGFIDHVCMTGRTNGSIYSNTGIYYIDHPIIIEDNRICMVLGKEKVCRDLYCDVFFDGIEMKGEYRLSAKYMFTVDKVVVKV